MTQRLPPAILRALESTNLPWSIIQGSKHRKLLVAGRFAAIIPTCKLKERDRANKNVISDIRNAARKFHVEH